MDTIRMACVFRGAIDQLQKDMLLDRISSGSGLLVRHESVNHATILSCCSHNGVFRMRVKGDKAVGSASFYGDADALFEQPLMHLFQQALELTEAKGSVQYMWRYHCNTIHFQKGRIAFRALADRTMAELEGIDLVLAMHTAKGYIAILLERLWKEIRNGNHGNGREIEESLLEWQQRLQILEYRHKKEKTTSVNR